MKATAGKSKGGVKSQAEGASSERRSDTDLLGMQIVVVTCPDGFKDWLVLGWRPEEEEDEEEVDVAQALWLS